MSKQPSPSAKSASESESDPDVYGASRRRNTSKKQRRQLVHAGSDSGPTHGEVRFSTRKAAKVSNYNEDDEDTFEEEDPDMLTPNYWTTVPDENIQAIDLVLNHRLREGTSKVIDCTSWSVTNLVKAKTSLTRGGMTSNITYVNLSGCSPYIFYNRD